MTFNLKLADRVGRIQPSATLALTARAKQLRTQGKDVIALTAGEPDFDTPIAIREAAAERIRAGGTVSRYTPASGLPEVRQAVAHKLKRDNGLDYAPEQVMVSCGAKHCCFNMIAALVNEGDEVILPSPYWVSYPEMIRFFGGEPIIVDTSATDFVLTPENLKGAITPKTRLLIVNTPGNPTGAVWSRKEQAAIADALKGTDIAVLSDEIYEKLVYDGEHVSFAALSDDAYQRTVTINGVAKAYAMTGWRIGYAAGPKPLIAAMGALQSHSTSNPTTLAQFATVDAVREDPAELADWRAQFVRRRDLLVKGLNDIEGVKCATPGGAFYVFPDFRAWMGKRHGDVNLNDDAAICEALLTKALVAGVPGGEFGAPGFVRLSYAVSDEQLEQAIERIGKFASELET
jgi:aspartate aminotransferase